MLVAFHPRLRRLQQDDPQIVSLRIACQDRLRLVEERTAKSNELLSTLKTYYPAFLGLFGDHTSQIALEFLRQFPTQHQMKSLSPGKLRRWLKAHHYPKPDRVEAMIQQCKAPALPVPDHQQTSKAPLLQYLCTALETLNELIVQQDQTITRDFDPLPQSDWPKSLPGAGTALEPALLAVFGRDPNRFESVEEARALMGTGPVTKSSGKSRVILFRRGCWKFARRTLHLFADMTRTRCAWAKEFYQRQRAAGKKHHMALRALAHKWTKIIWALVRTGQPYKEAIFVQSQSRYRREAINRTK
jgi:transposase